MKENREKNRQVYIIVPSCKIMKEAGRDLSRRGLIKKGRSSLLFPAVKVMNENFKPKAEMFVDIYDFSCQIINFPCPNSGHIQGIYSC